MLIGAEMPTKHRIVHALLQGKEDPQKVDLLLSLTNISSDTIRQALKQHLTEGTPAQMLYMIYDIKQQNFCRAMKRLNEVYSIVCQLNNIT